ncbi:PI-type proteinase [Rhodococcus sp. 3Y1]
MNNDFPKETHTMSEQNSTDRTDQTDEPQTTGTDHGPGTGSDTAPKDVQTDPSGERYVGRRGRSLEHRPGD